jgi:protein-tyrosine phosphatase
MSSVHLARIFSVVEYGNLRFLILDCPTKDNLSNYLTELQARNVVDVVRVCQPTYDKNYFIQNGIQVHDYYFKDGGTPPDDTLDSFLKLCRERFGPFIKDNIDPTGHVIAVHCVAGLGRAPVLVAIALIEAGLTPLDAVDYVRRRRRGAFNSVQLQFLVDAYKKKSTGSWKNMGEVARALFGKRNSPPPHSSNEALKDARNRSDSTSSERSETSPRLEAFRGSLSKVCLDF